MKKSPPFSASVRVLGIVKVSIDAALGKKRLMGAALGDITIGNGHDPAGGTDGGKPVGNDEGGSALRQGIKGPLDLCFRHRAWGICLSVSYLFAFSYCSWGSQGKNAEVVCHSLLQWTTFCQNSPP